MIASYFCLIINKNASSFKIPFSLLFTILLLFPLPLRNQYPLTAIRTLIIIYSSANPMWTLMIKARARNEPLKNEEINPIRPLWDIFPDNLDCCYVPRHPPNHFLTCVWHFCVFFLYLWLCSYLGGAVGRTTQHSNSLSWHRSSRARVVVVNRKIRFIVCPCPKALLLLWIRK